MSTIIQHTILKAYKLRFYPNKTQEDLLDKTFGCIRFVWNNRVDNFLNHDKETPLTIKELKKNLEWLKEVPYNALEQKLQDFEETKRQFFNKTRKKKLGKPKFKKKGVNESFR